MKEIHAYRNNDGTYRVEGVGEFYDNGELVDASFKAARAIISITALDDKPSKEICTFTINKINYY